MERGTISAKGIAAITGRTEDAIRRRAAFEGWPADGREFRLAGLPADIRIRITVGTTLERMADQVNEKTERIFGSKGFDRACIGAGLIALGWLLAWMQFIGQRG